MYAPVPRPAHSVHRASANATVSQHPQQQQAGVVMAVVCPPTQKGVPLSYASPQKDGDYTEDALETHPLLGSAAPDTQNGMPQANGMPPASGRHWAISPSCSERFKIRLGIMAVALSCIGVVISLVHLCMEVGWHDITNYHNNDHIRGLQIQPGSAHSDYSVRKFATKSWCHNIAQSPEMALYLQLIKEQKPATYLSSMSHTPTNFTTNAFNFSTNALASEFGAIDVLSKASFMDELNNITRIVAGLHKHIAKLLPEMALNVQRMQQQKNDKPATKPTHYYLSSVSSVSNWPFANKGLFVASEEPNKASLSSDSVTWLNSMLDNITHQKAGKRGVIFSASDERSKASLSDSVTWLESMLNNITHKAAAAEAAEQAAAQQAALAKDERAAARKAAAEAEARQAAAEAAASEGSQFITGPPGVAGEKGEPGPPGPPGAPASPAPLAADAFPAHAWYRVDAVGDEYNYEASASPALGAFQNAWSRVHALDDDYSYGQIECEDAEFVDAGGDACSVYTTSPHLCEVSTEYANEDGMSAAEACCICKAEGSSGSPHASLHPPSLLPLSMQTQERTIGGGGGGGGADGGNRGLGQLQGLLPGSEMQTLEQILALLRDSSERRSAIHQAFRHCISQITASAHSIFS